MPSKPRTDPTKPPKKRAAASRSTSTKRGRGQASATRSAAASSPGSAAHAPRIAPPQATARVSDRGDTASALIHAAMELFGERGFAAVSTRALADRAGANLAAIQYHFGGKDALYHAALQHVVDVFTPQVDLATELFRRTAPGLAGQPQALAALLAAIAERLIRTFLAEPEMRVIVPFMLRELFVPSQHFEFFYDALPRRLHVLMSELVALVRGGSAQDETNVLHAHALIGQIVIFHIGRPILMRRMRWRDYTPKRIEQVVRTVVPSLQRALGLPEVVAADATR